MGAVYLAEHTVLGRRAAIKVLHADLSGRPEVVARFFNEARATSRIQHPGLVDVLDFGQAEGTGGYIVMELLQGESLGSRLRRDGKLGPELIVPIARQLAAAVGAAHEHGIVHRDLKPDNVFLVPDREVACG